MDKPAPNSAAVRNPVQVLKTTHYPQGTGPKMKRMAHYEREAARRKWLMISGAIVSALAIGVLIGRFLVP